MYFIQKFVLPALLLAVPMLSRAEVATPLPIQDTSYPQQTHIAYTTDDGLPEGGVVRIKRGPEGTLYTQSESGAVFGFDGERWTPQDAPTALFVPRPDIKGIADVSAVARHGGEVAVAAEGGLYLGDGKDWTLAMPRQGDTRWAPVDVRAVAFDADGQLWFAAPMGVGCRVGEDEWRLFTGADGLPFNDFTCMAAGATGVWFGTTNGAIQYHDGQWSFRQGRRWLLDNHVRDIAIDTAGDPWFATAGGVSRIRHVPMTLATKAAFYEDEIEKYHRRTIYGYVNPATLATPGDKDTAQPRFSDNDGFNTGLYLAAMSFAWAVTGDDQFRQHAQHAFRALAFLSGVTQGGEHGGPPGLIARNVVPTTEPDPGAVYDKDYDVNRNKRDTLWKIMDRRIPVDATGEWYWKADASSDELDGHFFGSAIYFDNVRETEAEKDTVRTVVRRLIDHLIDHGYNLVDYDGTPTRWGHFSPDDLNRNPAWQAERGLNSYSMLTYLAIAHHILGDQKYREAYLNLAFDHGYGMNGMTQPREQPGPNSPGHQPDDNMAFMNYYHLIRYETDPTLLSMYQYAIRSHWTYEQPEANAFTNFVYAACAQGKTRTDQWGTIDLSPPFACYEDAVDTLRRYPLDLIEWPMSNAHRTDLIPMDTPEADPPKVGRRVDGHVFPIDERQETYWDWDPWKLTSGGDGTTLRPGFHYLLAYYMGRYHGFVAGEQGNSHAKLWPVSDWATGATVRSPDPRSPTLTAPPPPAQNSPRPPGRRLRRIGRGRARGRGDASSRACRPSRDGWR